MPIYEYQTHDRKKSCAYCRAVFEILELPHDPPLRKCPRCGKPVKRIISGCRSSISAVSGGADPVEKQIKQYENAGMWSHAAELADTHSEKTKSKNLKNRALDNYKKAGYDTKLLDKHAK